MGMEDKSAQRACLVLSLVLATLSLRSSRTGAAMRTYWTGYGTMAS